MTPTKARPEKSALAPPNMSPKTPGPSGSDRRELQFEGRFGRSAAIALGMSLGAGIGMALGTAFDNMAVGVSVGSGVGLAVGYGYSRRRFE